MTAPKRGHGLLILLLVFPGLAGCTVQPGSTDTPVGPDVDWDTFDNGGSGGPDADEDEVCCAPPEPDCCEPPAIPGFDLQLEEGTYWVFYGVEEEQSYAQGSSPSSSSTAFSFRVTLGAKETIDGMPAHKVHVRGEHPLSHVPTHVAVDGDRLLASRDGRTLHTVVDGQTGSWEGGGFFASFPASLTVEPREATDAGGPTYTIALSSEDPKCRSYRDIGGGTICAGDEESSRSVTETYRPGIGPTAYRATFSYSSSGGGFYSSHRSETTLRLAGTSLASPAGWEPDPAPWAEAAPMPTPRAYAVAASWNGSIYVFGGQKITRGGDGALVYEPLDVVEQYDPETDRWETRAPMPVAYFGDGNIYSLTAATHGDHVYLFGLGSHETEGLIIRSLIYDPEADAWSTGKSARAPIAFPQAVTVGDLIIVFGPDSQAGTTEGYAYDPLADTWLVGPTVPQFVSRFGIAHHGGGIYVIGGLDVDEKWPTDRVNVFQSTGQWTRTDDLPLARQLPLVLDFGDRLYVAGGYLTGVLDGASWLDWGEGTWTSAPRLPQPRVHAATAVANGKGYVFGGMSAWGEDADYEGGVADLQLATAYVFTPGAPGV